MAYPSLPSQITLNGIRYQAYGDRMRKLLGENEYDWGIKPPPALATAADSATAGNVDAGVYRVAVVAESNLGYRSNPYKTDADFDYSEVTVAAGSHTIVVTIPAHPDPQVTRMLVYRTLKNEVSPYYYAGYVANGTLTLSLNGADASLSTTDYLEGPISAASDDSSLAGPFRYGRPPAKALAAVVMDDIVFVGGEEAYTLGHASATNGSAFVTFTGSVLNRDMVGKSFRFTDESDAYTVKTVLSTLQVELEDAYARPGWRAADPSGQSYEIIGDASIIAPSAPGEPEYFCPVEQFTVGKDDGGRIRAIKAYGREALIFTENRIYIVNKGYTEGIFDRYQTGSIFGTIAPRSVCLTKAGVAFFTGEHLCMYSNQQSSVFSDPVAELLLQAHPDMVKHAITKVMGSRLFFAYSRSSVDHLDTILTLDMDTGAWDAWDGMRLVDMNAVTLASGEQRLFILSPVYDNWYARLTPAQRAMIDIIPGSSSGTVGYVLHQFNDTCYGDGVGNTDYSGTVTSATADTLTQAAKTFPTAGFGLRGLPVRIDGGRGEGQVRYIESNTATTLTLETQWDTLPDTSSTYTIGAILMTATTGKLSLPDPHTESVCKFAELRLEEQ